MSCPSCGPTFGPVADRDFNGEILNLLGEELVMKVFVYAGNRPVSFSAIVQELILRRVDALHGRGKSKQFIARKVGKSVRQVERYLEQLRLEEK